MSRRSRRAALFWLHFACEDEQVPTNSAGKPFLQLEGNPSPIFLQWKVSDLHLQGTKLGKKPASLMPGKSVGDRAFRAIRAMVDKIARTQIRPALLKKVSIVH